MFIQSEFKRRVLDLIDGSEISIKQVSADIDISEAWFSKLKKDKVKAPGADTVCALARYFNVSADWLLGLSDVKTTDKATKETCTALGLSESSVDLLLGDVGITGDQFAGELAEYVEYLKSVAVAHSREVVDILLKEHREKMQMMCAPSLIERLHEFFQSLEADPLFLYCEQEKGMLNVVLEDNQKCIANINHKIDEKAMSRLLWAVNLKENQTAIAIQNINKYLIDKREESLGAKEYGNNKKT